MKKKLTTTVVITVYLLIMGTLGIIASVPSHVAKASKEKVRKEIIRNISLPRALSEGKDITEVKALVSVDGTGKVHVEQVQSTNLELRNYVINQLQDASIKNVASPEKFVLLIRFIAS